MAGELAVGVVGGSWVAPGEPLPIRMWIENAGTEPVSIDAHTNPHCFASTWLDLSVEPLANRSSRLRCEPFTVVLAPGERVERVLDLAQEFGPVAASWRWTAAWRDHGHRLSNRTGGAGAFTVSPARGEHRVERGGVFTLPDGVEVTFVAHGHKRTSPGQESPLMVALRVGDSPEVRNVNLYLARERQFPVGAWVVELLEHAYDDWMTLRVFGPASPP